MPHPWVDLVKSTKPLRVQFAKVGCLDFGMNGGLIVCSLYLEIGIGIGIGTKTWQRLMCVGETINCFGKPFVIGAGFNFSASVICELGWPASMQGRIAASEGGPCRSRLGSLSTIDYFVVSRHLRPPSNQCSLSALSCPSRICRYGPFSTPARGNDGTTVKYCSCPVTQDDLTISNIVRGSCDGQQALEGLTILVALRLWNDQHDSKRVRLAVKGDNLETLTLLFKMLPKSARQAILARGLALVTVKKDFPLAVTHTPGVSNVIAVCCLG